MATEHKCLESVTQIWPLYTEIYGICYTNMATVHRNIWYLLHKYGHCTQQYMVSMAQICPLSTEMYGFSDLNM